MDITTVRRHLRENGGRRRGVRSSQDKDDGEDVCVTLNKSHVLSHSPQENTTKVWPTLEKGGHMC